MDLIYNLLTYSKGRITISLKELLFFFFLILFSLASFSQATIIKTINSNCELELCLSCGHVPLTWSFSNPSAVTDLGGGGGCSVLGKTLLVTGYTSVTVNYDKWGCAGFGPGNPDVLTFSLSPSDMIPSKKASSITAATSAICAGQSVTLTKNGGSLANNGVWTWYQGGCGGASIGTGNSITVSPTSTTTYFVRAEDDCGNTTCVSKAVTVNPLPAQPGTISGPSPICGGSQTYSISAVSGATSYSWSYSGGGTPTGTGVSTTFTPTSSGTLSVTATNSCGTSSAQTLPIVLNTSSTAPTSITGGGVICGGSPTTLTVNGGSLGTGAIVNWYTGSCGGTLVGTGASITVSPTVNTTYYVRYEGACNTTSCVSVGIIADSPSNSAFTFNGSDLVATYCTSDADPTPNNTGTSGGAYSSSPSGLSINSTTGVIDLSASTPGIYDVTYAVGGSCGTDYSSMKITINGGPAQPGAISGSTPICGGSQTYSISAVSGATSYSWSYSGGGTPTGTGVSTTFTPTSSGTLSVTATNSCGSSVSNPFAIVLNSNDDPSFSYDNNSYCMSGTDPIPTITGLSGGSFYGASPLVVNSTTGEISLSSTGVGTFDVTYVTNGSCPDSSVFQVTISTAPSADFSYPSGGNICLGSGVLDVVFGAGASSGAYSSTNGIALNASNGQIDLVSSAPGLYVVTNTIAASGSCLSAQATDTVVLLALDDASFNFGGDSVFCENESNINATITGVSNGVFTSSPAGLGIGAQGNVDFSNSTLDVVYMVTYTTAAVCPNSDSMTILINSSPSAPVLLNDTSICNGDSLVLLASGGGAGVSYPVYDALTGGNILGNAPLAVFPNSTMSYYIEAVDANGCMNLAGLQAINVTVHNLPNIDLGPDVSLCPGNSALLTVQEPGSYIWSTNELNQSINVTPVSSTLYWVDFMDANQCSASDSIMVDVISLGTTLVANDDNYVVDLNASNSFMVLSNDQFVGSVTPAIIQNPYNGSVSVDFNGQILYETTLTSSGADSLVYHICDVACPNVCDSATVFITVEELIEIKIPGGLSPNGDLFNDVFYIGGLDQFESTKLTIFNRWGDIVYQAAPYLNDWEGTSNASGSLIGGNVTAGTYYYILEVLNQDKQFTGFIEVK